MSPEAQRILEVFKSRGLRAGGIIRYEDFGDAIVLENGFIREPGVREALLTLSADNYLVEHTLALELTELGEKHLYGSENPRHGARVYRVGRRLLVKQTVLRGFPAEYVIDEQRERLVPEDDDAAILAAIRDAVNGRI